MAVEEHLVGHQWLLQSLQDAQDVLLLSVPNHSTANGWCRGWRSVWMCGWPNLPGEHAAVGLVVGDAVGYAVGALVGDAVGYAVG